MKFFCYESRSNLIIINFIRALFAGIFIFELFNFLKILQFKLEYTWLGLLVTLVASLLILEFSARKYKNIKGHYLHWSMWFVALFALSLDIVGDVFHLFGRFFWWDKLAHTFTSAIVAFTLFVFINAFWMDKFKFSLLFTTGRFKLSLFLATTATITLSVLYEIEEYVEDLLFHSNRLGPGVDTADDLLYNLIGVLIAMLFVLIYYLITRKREIFE